MKWILVIITSLFLMTVMLPAANHYIRQGASGNGSDWTNALGEMPATQVRGDTYYIADGEYGGVTLAGAHSGTKRIIMKKATAANHGTDTGWKPEYGDGYAKFPGMTIEKGYITIDGVTGGGPGSWDTGHGFWVHIPTGNRRAIYIRERSFSYVQLHGIEVRHIKITCDPNQTVSGIQPTQTTPIGPIYEYLYFKDFWGNAFQNAGLEDMVIRYNLVDRMYKYGSAHMEAIQGGNDNNKNFTVAYNIWKDCIGTGVLMLHGTGHKVYGNTFMWSEYMGTTINNGVIGTTSDGMASNVQINNNTFVDMPVGLYGTGSHVGHTAKNNIFVNTYDNSNTAIKEVNWGSVAHSHNYYFKAGTHTESGTQQQATSHPFVSYTEFGGLANDLHLAGPTSPGDALAAEYNTDPEGVTRGADGVWDRGAFEYLKTNIEYRLKNDECRIPAYPTPKQIFNILGGQVQSAATGIYLVPMVNKLEKVTRIK